VRPCSQTDMPTNISSNRPVKAPPVDPSLEMKAYTAVTLPIVCMIVTRDILIY
jgi:hypothetical protein